MAEQPNNPLLATVETGLFGTLFRFHKKAMNLLRESSLDDEKRKVVANRLNTLLDETTAEINQTQQLKLADRLEAIYEEVRRLVDESAKNSDCGKGG